MLAERTFAAAVEDPPQLRVNLLLLLGYIAWLQVKYELALQYADRGEELATEAMLPDSSGFLLLRWLHDTYNGAFTKAEPLLEPGLALLAPPERAVAHVARKVSWRHHSIATATWIVRRL